MNLLSHANCWLMSCELKVVCVWDTVETWLVSLGVTCGAWEPASCSVLLCSNLKAASFHFLSRRKISGSTIFLLLDCWQTWIQIFDSNCLTDCRAAGVAIPSSRPIRFQPSYQFHISHLVAQTSVVRCSQLANFDRNRSDTEFWLSIVQSSQVRLGSVRFGP